MNQFYFYKPAKPYEGTHKDRSFYLSRLSVLTILGSLLAHVGIIWLIITFSHSEPVEQINTSPISARLIFSKIDTPKVESPKIEKKKEKKVHNKHEALPENDKIEPSKITAKENRTPSSKSNNPISEQQTNKRQQSNSKARLKSDLTSSSTLLRYFEKYNHNQQQELAEDNVKHYHRNLISPDLSEGYVTQEIRNAYKPKKTNCTENNIKALVFLANRLGGDLQCSNVSEHLKEYIERN